MLKIKETIVMLLSVFSEFTLDSKEVKGKSIVFLGIRKEKDRQNA